MSKDSVPVPLDGVFNIF